MNNPSLLRLLRAATSLVALALAAGCGGGSDSPGTVLTAVGPEGATLVGPDGVQVLVPAGALAEPVTIGIAPRSEGAPGALPADSQLASAIYEFTPHGLVFEKPRNALPGRDRTGSPSRRDEDAGTSSNVPPPTRLVLILYGCAALPTLHCD